jgi:methylated-DNA-protein-cysteine methyltransferase-like protein
VDMVEDGDVDSFAQVVKRIIKAIPAGKVATYGQIAALAGNPRAVRGVVWILHSSSRKAALPWHRVVNRRGQISLRPGQGCEEQRALLESEGVPFDTQDRIDLTHHLWHPTTQDSSAATDKDL